MTDQGGGEGVDTYIIGSFMTYLLLTARRNNVEIYVFKLTCKECI